MIPGSKNFGLHTTHFTEEVEYVSYVVVSDGRKVGYSSRSVAEASAEYERRQGHTNVTIEERRSTLRCGEVYY